MMKAIPTDLYPDRPRCATCIYWAKDPDYLVEGVIFGECRPRADAQRMREETYWCGEHQDFWKVYDSVTDPVTENENENENEDGAGAHDDVAEFLTGVQIAVDTSKSES